MKIIIFRRNITNKSGTGQLILMQVKELISQGKKFHVYCMKGFIKVWIGTKILPRKAILKNDQLHIKEAKDYIVIDHDASLYNADYTFIHNLILKEKEQRKPYIEWLKNSHCQIIANSEYTKKIYKTFQFPNQEFLLYTLDIIIKNSILIKKLNIKNLQEKN
ncbi:hypothetical protein NS972_003017 [Vibrio cholerae]